MENPLHISQDAIKKIALKHKLALMVLFGLYATKTNRESSDIDIAYWGESKVDNQLLYEDLIELYSRADIDLVDLSITYNHFFLYTVFSQAVVLYEKKTGLVADLHGKAFIDYIDFQKYYKMKRKILYQIIDTLSENSKFER